MISLATVECSCVGVPGTETAMDVTDHKFSTELVGADDASARGCHRRSPAGRGSTTLDYHPCITVRM